jgi:hypothetical protein
LFVLKIGQKFFNGFNIIRKIIITFAALNFYIVLFGEQYLIIKYYFDWQKIPLQSPAVLANPAAPALADLVVPAAQADQAAAAAQADRAAAVAQADRAAAQAGQVAQVLTGQVVPEEGQISQAAQR